MKSNPIPALVAKASERTQAGTLARNKALMGVRYRLMTPTGCVGLNGSMRAVIVPPESPLACVFDGRDNEVAKCAFFSALLKCEVIPAPI